MARFECAQHPHLVLTDHGLYPDGRVIQALDQGLTDRDALDELEAELREQNARTTRWDVSVALAAAVLVLDQLRRHQIADALELRDLLHVTTDDLSRLGITEIPHTPTSGDTP